MFKTNRGHYFEFLTSEMMKLLGSNKSNLLSLEITGNSISPL